MCYMLHIIHDNKKLEKTNSVRCCKCSFPATNKTSFVVGRRHENTFFGTYRTHAIHTMLRLDATPKKRCLGFDFKFKKFSIKKTTFITKEIFPSRVHKFFFEVFFQCFLRFLLVLVLFSKSEIFEKFLNNKIRNLCL